MHYFSDKSFYKAKNKTITLKQVIVIDSILNKNSSYIKKFGIESGHELELTFKITSSRSSHSHKITIKNLMNGIEVNNIVPKQAFEAFACSFEYHEEI